MQPDDRRERLRTIALGLAVLFMPALILVTALEFLILTGDLTLSDLSLLDVVELYLIELVVFAVGAYLLYRILLFSVPEPADEESEE